MSDQVEVRHLQALEPFRLAVFKLSYLDLLRGSLRSASAFNGRPVPSTRHPKNWWLGPGLKTRLFESPKSIELELLGTWFPSRSTPVRPAALPVNSCS